MDALDHGPKLTVNVPLDERDVPETSGAVQGTLFPDEFPAERSRETRGYRGTVASKVAGITYRQLDYWARKQIVEPSINPSHGSGTRRLYSFKDVVILAVSKKLLDAGVNLQNVTTAIGYLQRCRVEALSGVTIMSDGEHVHECMTDDQVLAMVHGGSAVFGVSVGALWHHIHDMLEHEDYVDLTALPSATASSGRVIDELAQMRMRRKLEAQRQLRAEHHARRQLE